MTDPRAHKFFSKVSKQGGFMSGAKPTLGRIVHYHGVNGTGTEVVTEAAVVIGEYNDPYDAADLLVFGLRRTRRCLGVRQGEAAGQWSWPTLVH